LLKLPYSDWQIVNATLIVYVLALVVGANFLYEPPPVDPGATDQTISAGERLFAGIFNAASAFGNAGHWIGKVPDQRNLSLYFVALPLAVIGGLGIPVILDLASSLLHWRAIQPHTGAVLLMTSLIFVVGSSLMVISEWSNIPEAETVPTSPAQVQEESQRVNQARRDGIVNAAVEAIDSRTFGLPTSILGTLSRPAQWWALLLMLIGASTAGTGGGIKSTTPYVLARDSTRILMGRPINRGLAFAVIWVVVYLLAVLITTILLIDNYPQVQSDRLLFLAVSAIGNVGASQEPITLAGPSIHVLTLAMLFGRFAPMALLWWAATQSPGEMDVAVG
jgi:trk system potassium uptake protein TrkH